ncbi:LysR substrate-binding domain-containing protein [Subtercola vilae]|uniref:LysR substrate-binding domain-containing protein n=1 Tax=Subtercola vilae TaxID=2056433 RepID=UPI001375DBDF|nr:LysR substrate-binding domain-containing protein [Subtercola vilae]MEA9985431.1 LysR substrate-binding domain-containing protein [Subtercola sp. RTI3]
MSGNIARRVARGKYRLAKFERCRVRGDKMIGAGMSDNPFDEVPPFRIAFAVGVTVTKWTRLWQERHPDVPLSVFRSEPGLQTAVLGAGVADDDVIAEVSADVSFVRLPIDAEALSVINLYQEVQVVMVSRDHAVAAVDEVTVSDLADEHLLQNPDDVPEWRDVAAELQDGSRRPLRGIQSLDDAVEQVAAGVGVVIVPQSLARMHTRKDVVYRPVTDVAETQIALAWVAGNPSPQVAEFIGIVRGRSATSSRDALDTTAVISGGRDGEQGQVAVKKIGPVAKAKAKARAAQAAEDAAAGKRGSGAGKSGGGASGAAAARKKKQSDQANAAQARRRKFGGKR